MRDNRGPDDGGRKAEDRCQRTEGGGRMAEKHGARSVGQETGGRRTKKQRAGSMEQNQRSEGRDQRTEAGALRLRSAVLEDRFA